MKLFLSFTAIICLLFVSGPSAVFGTIRTIVVNPVQSLAIWTMSHVLKKVFKLQPAFANSDTPTSISIPILRFRIKAPILHPVPRPIRFCIRHAMDFSALISGSYLPSVTTATGSLPDPHRISFDGDSLSTRANAITPSSSFFYKFRYHNKPSVCVSDYTNFIWHVK